MREAKLLAMLGTYAAFARGLSALLCVFEGPATSMLIVGCVQDLDWNADWVREVSMGRD